MCHHQQSHPLTCQVVLEPFYYLNVKMVGGLVKNYHIGIVKQQPGECHALALSAGERIDAGVQVSNVQACEHLTQAVLIVPGIAAVHHCHCFGYLLVIAR